MLQQYNEGRKRKRDVRNKNRQSRQGHDLQLAHLVDGKAAAAGVLQLALVDVEQHAWDKGELAETHVEKVVVVAAEEHGGGDDGALALEVDGMVGKHKRLNYVGRLAGFKRCCDEHHSLEEPAVHPQAGGAVARDNAEADDEFVARLLLAVGKAGGTEVVEHELEHFEILRNAERFRSLGVSIKNVPHNGNGAL